MLEFEFVKTADVNYEFIVKNITDVIDWLYRMEDITINDIDDFNNLLNRNIFIKWYIEDNITDYDTFLKDNSYMMYRII